MLGKRPIDIQRDAAFTLQIDGEDKSATKEVLATVDNLYVIKEKSVLKLMSADDIDPDRTNPKIPNLSQQVLTAGYDNEIVARVLLTAKYLFDEHNAIVKPFVANLFENCITLTRQLLELDAMTRKLEEDIVQNISAFAVKPPAPNAFRLPSVPGLDTHLHTILTKADKAKDTILKICRLQFLPDVVEKGKLADLEKAIEESLSGQPQQITAWKEIIASLGLIRNLRNVSEHPNENQRVVVTDFSMRPDAQVNPPIVQIDNPDTPIRTLPVVDFIKSIRNIMVDRAEIILPYIRLAVLLKDNPVHEQVFEFPVEQRRHKFVRFYPAINSNGTWHILG